MTDPKQIPFLVHLLDDDTEEVRSQIVEELTSFGPMLKEEVDQLFLSLNRRQNRLMDAIYETHRVMKLKQMWPSWFYLESSTGKLEASLSLLSEFLTAPGSDISLKHLLDDLASDYLRKYTVKDHLLLAEFLFKEIGLKGNENDYYNPQNSNLVYVITAKRGIPISLTAVYILVGARLGLHIEGCHFPGHFLARIKLDNRNIYVDCFNGGQIIEEADLMHVREDLLDGLRNILEETSDAQVMVRRFLANVIRAYQMVDDEQKGALMMDLFKELDILVCDYHISTMTPDDIICEVRPVFSVGSIVHHCKYGYRGVIVDIDRECKSTDAWYYSNQTQPDRYQPWYHVLVDGSDQVTYVAQANLETDVSSEKVMHPLMAYFFNQLQTGEYIRNENPWPETDF